MFGYGCGKFGEIVDDIVVQGDDGFIVIYIEVEQVVYYVFQFGEIFVGFFGWYGDGFDLQFLCGQQVFDVGQMVLGNNFVCYDNGVAVLYYFGDKWGYCYQCFGVDDDVIVVFFEGNFDGD